MLPSAISECKCQAHTNAKDFVSTGNAKADAAARTAAQQGLTHTHTPLHADTDTDIPLTLHAMQQFATSDEKRTWQQAGCKYADGLWIGPNDKPCLPKCFFPTLC